MRRPFDPALSARLDYAVMRMEATRGWRRRLVAVGQKVVGDGDVEEIYRRSNAGG